MCAMWVRRPASIAAASARLMAARLTGVLGSVPEISPLDSTMIEPRIGRLATSVVLNRTPKPRRSIRRGGYWRTFRTYRKGADRRHLTAPRKLERDRSSLDLFTLTPLLLRRASA